jgi:hypothetical protein
MLVNPGQRRFVLRGLKRPFTREFLTNRRAELRTEKANGRA